MPTLRAPNGRTYDTDDDAEIMNLTVGHGYTVIPTDLPTSQAAPRAGRAKPPTSAESTAPTVAGETTD